MENGVYCVGLPLLAICLVLSITAIVIAVRAERQLRRLADHIRSRPHEPPQAEAGRPQPSPASRAWPHRRPLRRGPRPSCRRRS